MCGGATSPATSHLIDELLLEAEQLVNHNFARHVLELVLEHGSTTHKQKIAEAVRSNLPCNAKHRNASYVVEKALHSCSAPDAEAIARELLANPESFVLLAAHECGSHVARAVLKSHGDCGDMAKQLLFAEADRVKTSKYGKRLLDDM